MSGIDFRLAVGVSLSLSVAGCGERGPTPGEGYAQVQGGRVWYRIVGNGARTPLLVLHGGPGVPGYYLKPLAALADERPVIFYDQLGAGARTTQLIRLSGAWTGSWRSSAKYARRSD